MERQTCPYCGEVKEATEFTTEHVIPRKVGGNVEPTNPFLLDVCCRCNSASGRWIDGPFLKNWLIHHSRFSAHLLAVDPLANPVLPLAYMGRLKDWPEPERLTCELWLGPAGDQIYHLHTPYPTDPALVGRPPHLPPEALDPGLVLVALVASNPDWHPIVIRSVEAEFAGASIHYLNAAPPGQAPPYPPVPDKRRAELNWVTELMKKGSWRNLEAAIDIRSTDRFAAKLALGIGSLQLGEDFVGSPDAALLRRFMWAKNPEDRDAIPLHGVRMLEVSSHLTSALSWRDCHIVFLKPFHLQLGLVVNFFSQHALDVRVASDPTLWTNKVDEEGQLWVIAPGLRRFAGPMSLGTFLFEKGKQPPTGPLADLSKRLDRATRPPRDANDIPRGVAKTIT